MDNKLLELLDNFIHLLDKELEEYKNIKTKLLNDQELLNKINKLHNMNKYSSEYTLLKQELFEIEEYRKYLKYESELNLLSISLTNKLKGITKVDFNESN